MSQVIAHRSRGSMGRLTMMEQDLTNLGKFGSQIQETTAQKGSAERDINVRSRNCTWR